MYCGLDGTNVDSPDYSKRAVSELLRCVDKGARGVGEVSDKGWGLAARAGSPLPQARRLHPDDPRLDDFWEKCAELKLPVNLHIADHPSCWEPLGPTWERTPGYQRYNLFGQDVPSFNELMQMRDRLLAKHPRTLFIACHFSNQGHNLGVLSQVLDRFPNLYVDISARDYEIGRQPRTALKFFMRYKDRILFGTDLSPGTAMYESWWRLLESADEFMPGRIWWRLYGLELPKDVLRRVYQENARRILNLNR